MQQWAECAYGTCQIIVLAVGHKQFIEMVLSKIKVLTQGDDVTSDVKSALTLEEVDGRL